MMKEEKASVFGKVIPQKGGEHLTNGGNTHKISSVSDFDGKKDGMSCLQRAGGCCEPAEESVQY